MRQCYVKSNFLTISLHSSYTRLKFDYFNVITKAILPKAALQYKNIFQLDQITSFWYNNGTRCNVIWRAFVQVMASQLFGNKLLHQPMLIHCWLDERQ